MEVLELHARETEVRAAAERADGGRFARGGTQAILWAGPVLAQCKKMLPHLSFGQVELLKNGASGELGVNRWWMAGREI